MTERASNAALATAAGASASTPVPTTAGTWRLDPTSTTIEFHTKAMWGMAKVNGTFTAVSGVGVVGGQGAISGELVVDASSIETKNKRRDKHLRSADFLEVSKYPTFSFTASEVTPSDDGTLTITGALHIKDRSIPIDVVATSTSQSSERVTVTAEATIDRSRWGMTWAKMGAGLVNRVVVVAQFVRS
jgi:polyisoprenoid-binding protein YceI